jgi:hypothetical protein
MADVLDFLVTAVVPLLLPALAVIIGTVAAVEAKRWLPVAKAWAVAHVGQKNLDMAVTLAKAAVQYAETQGLLQTFTDSAEAKRSIAFSWANSALRAHGVRNVTADELAGLIESAWFQEWGRDKQVETKVQNAVTNIQNSSVALEAAPATCPYCPHNALA